MRARISNSMFKPPLARSRPAMRNGGDAGSSWISLMAELRRAQPRIDHKARSFSLSLFSPLLNAFSPRAAFQTAL
jgi:hypothetical protein